MHMFTTRGCLCTVGICEALVWTITADIFISKWSSSSCTRLTWFYFRLWHPKFWGHGDGARRLTQPWQGSLWAVRTGPLAEERQWVTHPCLNSPFMPDALGCPWEIEMLKAKLIHFTILPEAKCDSRKLGDLLQGDCEHHSKKIKTR